MGFMGVNDRHLRAARATSRFSSTAQYVMGGSFLFAVGTYCEYLQSEHFCGLDLFAIVHIVSNIANMGVAVLNLLMKYCCPFPVT